MQTNFYCIEKTSKHFVLSICLFLCHFFRRTVDCFAYFILNSESFRMEQVYIDSARSPLQEYIIKLNQRCLVQIDDSKYKAGRHLWPHCKIQNTMLIIVTSVILYKSIWEIDFQPDQIFVFDRLNFCYLIWDSCFK